jgi:hypothetical protein
MVKHIKIIIEKHPDGYIAYPLDLKGVVVGEGDSYRGSPADVTSAIRFILKRLGRTVSKHDSTVQEVLWSEASHRSLMPKWPVDAPRSKVIKTFELLGFRVVREGNHVSMVRDNP